MSTENNIREAEYILLSHRMNVAAAECRLTTTKLQAGRATIDEVRAAFRALAEIRAATYTAALASDAATLADMEAFVETLGKTRDELALLRETLDVLRAGNGS